MSLPPGPSSPMIVQTAAFIRRPFAFMQRCRDRYGDAFSVRLGFAGPDRGLVVGSSSLIREVFLGGEGLSGGKGNEPLRPVMGDTSVGLLDGEPHARHRRLLMPPFHGDRMRAYADVMRDVTVKHVSTWRKGDTFALLPRVLDIAMETILRTVFGMDGEDLEELRIQVTRLLRAVANPMVLMIPALQRDLPLLPWRRFVRERAATDALFYRHIAAARANKKNGREDILSMLVAAVDEEGKPLTDAELRDELVTLLLAGHETSATSLTWVVERLLAHPPVLADLKREIDEVVGTGPLQGSHVPKLVLLEAAIREALRQRPVSPGPFRKTTAPVTIGGHEVPVGTVVLASSYLAHHQADVYPEPDRFDPKRFLDQKPDAYAWIPFGGGPRRCIGMAYAMFQMKVVCATILASVPLELADAKPTPVTCRAVFQSPHRGLRVSVS